MNKSTKISIIILLLTTSILYAQGKKDVQRLEKTIFHYHQKNNDANKCVRIRSMNSDTIMTTKEANKLHETESCVRLKTDRYYLIKKTNLRYASSRIYIGEDLENKTLVHLFVDYKYRGSKYLALDSYKSKNITALTIDDFKKEKDLWRALYSSIIEYYQGLNVK